MIRFLNPQFLWLLSLLSIIIILHLIKPKRILVKISTLFLWERLFRKSQTSRWLRKLPKNILLILQLLILSLIVFTLAQPQWVMKGNIALPLVLIIDSSASTNAIDIKPSRFDVIKKEALNIVAKSSIFRSMAIIYAGYKPELKVSFTTNRSTIEKIIKELKSTYSNDTIQESIELAESLLPNTPKEIHILTDGNNPFTLPSNSINDYHIHIIGKGEDNVGITNAKLFPKNVNLAEFYLEISNFSNKFQKVPIVIKLNNAIMERLHIELAPKSNKKIIREVPNKETKIEVNLDINDDLKEDNSAYLYLPQPYHKILLITLGNPYLEKALKAIPGADLKIKRDVTQEDFIDFDFIVFDQLIPEYVPPGKYIFIGYPPFNFNFEQIGKISNTRIVSWEEIPIMSLIQPLNANIYSAILIKSKDLTPFLYSEKGPIGFIYDKKDIFAIVLTFSLLDTNWIYYDSFPIFIYNIINYKNSYNPYKSPGEPIEILDNSGWIYVGTPERRYELENKSGFVEFTETTKPGFYYIKKRAKNEIYVVNLFSKEESDIKPKMNIEINKQNKNKEKGTIYIDLSLYALILSIILLLLEAIIFLGGFNIT